MTTIICATNRPNNQTQKIVDLYHQVLHEEGVDCRVLSMEDLPSDFLYKDAYSDPGKAFLSFLDKYITASDSFVVISPEYNGSFPGVFKGFIDAFDPSFWRGKKVGLIGVSTGRAGNLRGMDHLTDVFHHMDVEVMPYKLPISKLNDLFDGKRPRRELMEVLKFHALKFHRYLKK